MAHMDPRSNLLVHSLQWCLLLLAEEVGAFLPDRLGIGFREVRGRTILEELQDSIVRHQTLLILLRLVALRLLWSFYGLRTSHNGAGRHIGIDDVLLSLLHLLGVLRCRVALLAHQPGGHVV